MHEEKHAERVEKLCIEFPGWRGTLPDEAPWWTDDEVRY